MDRGGPVWAKGIYILAWIGAGLAGARGCPRETEICGRRDRIGALTNVSGWGTFRLEISTAGVIESQQISGEKQIAGIKPRIDAMKFPELLPPESKAHLLRSAVVSCSVTSSCEVVLVPDGGLQTERQ
jgi:hypothetical protein